MEILVCVYLIEGQCCSDLSNNELKGRVNFYNRNTDVQTGKQVDCSTRNLNSIEPCESGVGNDSQFIEIERGGDFQQSWLRRRCCA